MRRIICLALLLVFIGVSAPTVFGASVKFVKEIPLVPNVKESKVELKQVVDFCVTDDGIFLFPDYLAGDIKLYKEDREALVFLKTVGSKGYYPGQFVKPSFCSFNKAENKFIILDMGTRRIYLYDRIGRDEFVREKKDDGNEVYSECPKGAYDIQLVGNRLFVAGHTSSDDKFYDFYSTDLTESRNSNVLKAEPKLLLTSNETYQIKEADNFLEQINAKYLEAIGYRNYFDLEGNFAYFVWMGNLRIIKVDISSGSKVGYPFGEKTRNYIQPETSRIKELANAFHLMVKNRESRDKSEFRAKYLRECRKFSIIQNLFTTSENIILIYEGPYIAGNSENFHVQFYSLEGKFVTEVPFRVRPDSIDTIVRFNRDNKTLYTLSKSESGAYYISIYKISI